VPGVTSHERRIVVLDGWPLVTASTVPLILLAVAEALRLKTWLAVDVALGVVMITLKTRRH
jgi:hypothetical protein